MKKRLLIGLLLVLMFVLLAGCGGNTEQGSTESKVDPTIAPSIEETEEPSSESGKIPAVTEFSVGFARKDITPLKSVPLSGYGNSLTRMSTGFVDRIMTTCIAVSDANNETVLFFTTDIVIASGNITSSIRSRIKTLTGIPEDHILVSTTHTHSSVDTAYSEQVPEVATFINNYITLAGEAAVEALQNRSAATMEWTTADLTGYNFIRHYLTEEGGYAGDNYGSETAKRIAHASEENSTMFILKFVRENDKDILMTNWRCHATLAGSTNKGDLSADFPYHVRNYVEQNSDCLMAYFQGDAGNSNPKSSIAEENCTGDLKTYGKEVGTLILKAMEGTWQQVKTGEVKLVSQEFVGNVNHTMDSSVSKAREIQSVWRSTNNRLQCVAMGEPYGITSPYHADAIISRCEMPRTRAMDFYAVQLGDLGIIEAGYEMFVQNGNFIRENSPYDYTLVIGYSNSHNSYLPSQDAFDYGCYEACIGYYERGTAEIAASTFIDMLKSLKK